LRRRRRGRQHATPARRMPKKGKKSKGGGRVRPLAEVAPHLCLKIDELGECELYGQKITDDIADSIAEELAAFENRERVRILDLAGNQLTRLPDKLQRLPNIETLSLQSNNIGNDGLPFWLDDLMSLKELWLVGNPLTELPRTLDKLMQLRRLEVDAALKPQARRILEMARMKRIAAANPDDDGPKEMEPTLLSVICTVS